MNHKVIEIKSIISLAFEKAYQIKENISNPARSALFVSNLANGLKSIEGNLSGIDKRVQCVDNSGQRSAGEWLLDITIVRTKTVRTTYKNRKSDFMVDSIIWAVESEMSSNINDFTMDFSKLLNVKAENYLYIGGLTKKSAFYIEAQLNLAKELIDSSEIYRPFYYAFIPSPHKSGGKSVWDKHSLSDLEKWIEVEWINNL